MIALTTRQDVAVFLGSWVLACLFVLSLARMAARAERTGFEAYRRHTAARAALRRARGRIVMPSVDAVLPADEPAPLSAVEAAAFDDIVERWPFDFERDGS